MPSLEKPNTDPTPIFELFRGSYGTELLVAASAHFKIFDLLTTPHDFAQLAAALSLAPRPLNVLLTALRAMNLIEFNGSAYTNRTLASEHLRADADFNVCGYLALAAESPGVKQMIACLESNRPIGADDDAGTAFIFNQQIESSAMDSEISSRFLTLALMGRAKNVAPYLAEAVDLSHCKHLLDVGGGTGIYAIGFLKQYPGLKATVLDHPNVLKLANEFRERYGVTERLSCTSFDMFSDKVPQGDVVLLSNILHDWDVEENLTILRNCAKALSPGDRLLIHDVFLDDTLDGPLPIALYSAALFTLTRGRAYSKGEYTEMLGECGFQVTDFRPTLVHCGVLIAEKL